MDRMDRRPHCFAEWSYSSKESGVQCMAYLEASRTTMENSLSTIGLIGVSLITPCTKWHKRRPCTCVIESTFKKNYISKTSAHCSGKTSATIFTIFSNPAIGCT